MPFPSFHSNDPHGDDPHVKAGGEGVQCSFATQASCKTFSDQHVAEDMHQFTTKRNSNSFDGELLASVEGNPVHSDSGENRYRLLVYRASTGTFVPVIELVSPTAGGSMLSLADEMDTLNDVEDFFFAFEPAELLPDAMASLPGEERAALLGRLYLEFEQQVGILLRVLNSRLTNESASNQVHG